MAGRRLRGVVLLLACGGISLWWGVTLWPVFPGGAIDFQSIYYATRCLIQHQDPYNLSELKETYQYEVSRAAPDTVNPPDAVLGFIYLPTVFPVAAPFAVLPWAVARFVWTALLFAMYLLAEVLMFWEGAKDAQGVALLVACLLLVNSEVLFGGGNPAGFAVSLCVIAVYCFFRERFAWLGVLCLAISLALKPHDGGTVWLYLLLAGGMQRRRALQTLGVAAVLGAVAMLWISQVSPHWLREWHANLTTISQPGHTSDPGAVTAQELGATGTVIDLQSVVAVFRNDAGVYNPVAYGICGVMLLLWVWVTVRRHISRDAPWLALAAVVPITMLATYHRPYDAKLLLLAIPACAMLWAKGGKLGGAALVVTSAAALLTSDLPISILLVLNAWLRPSASTMTGKFEVLVLTRAPSLVLLAMAVFYLWVYARRAGDEARGGQGDLQLSWHYRGHS